MKWLICALLAVCASAELSESCSDDGCTVSENQQEFVQLRRARQSDETTTAAPAKFVRQGGPATCTFNLTEELISVWYAGFDVTAQMKDTTPPSIELQPVAGAWLVITGANSGGCQSAGLQVQCNFGLTSESSAWSTWNSEERPSLTRQAGVENGDTAWFGACGPGESEQCRCSIASGTSSPNAIWGGDLMYSSLRIQPEPYLQSSTSDFGEEVPGADEGPLRRFGQIGDLAELQTGSSPAEEMAALQMKSNRGGQPGKFIRSSGPSICQIVAANVMSVFYNGFDVTAQLDRATDPPTIELQPIGGAWLAVTGQHSETSGACANAGLQVQCNFGLSTNASAWTSWNSDAVPSFSRQAGEETAGAWFGACDSGVTEQCRCEVAAGTSAAPRAIWGGDQKYAVMRVQPTPYFHSLTADFGEEAPGAAAGPVRSFGQIGDLAEPAM